jgi:hypothetical protein
MNAPLAVAVVLLPTLRVTYAAEHRASKITSLRSVSARTLRSDVQEVNCQTAWRP